MRPFSVSSADLSGAQQHHGRMGGGGVSQGGGCGIEIDVGGGDELLLRVAAEDGVHTG